MKKKQTIRANNLELEDIQPLTKNQAKAFSSDKHLVLHGAAGTGKTFISSFIAYQEIAERYYDKLVIIRSAVPTRDMGFLPGSEKEKAAVYEEPYKDIATELYGRGDAYEILKKQNLVHFMTTSFIRGITIKDCVVIVDECQNMTFQELDSIITRVGENCKIIFCGDFLQSDLKDTGIQRFFKILKSTNEFDYVDFKIEDIVRSGLVKKYLVARHLDENPITDIKSKTDYVPVTYGENLTSYGDT